ncbi:MAG: class I SAM-dependent methyltransferase [Deltaproteobacteria bacterium]|nr:class I SAM-dependent methyltransferase [Deltaproteobacteria bacterium]
MNVTEHLSETAFLTNESRSRMVDVSKDIYAHLWVTPATKKIWDDFAAYVYKHDDVELSIRNRYYLENLKAFLQEHQDPVFINIAAGFTSYPFLINAPCHCIEIDYQHVIDFKRPKILEWQKNGQLPKCDLEFYGTDLTNKHDHEQMTAAFKHWIGNRPSFVLLEGITYYLEPKVLDQLLKLIASTQTKGSLLGLEYWTPDIVEHPVFIRLEDYFEKRFHYKKGTYHLIDDDFIRSLPNYDVVEITDVKEQEQIFCDQTILDDYAVGLPTSMSVLRKK